MLNRSDQPRILEPEQLAVQRPERIKLPNGVPLSVLNAGDNEVTRIDLLMAGGRWQQKQPLQALFTNRMLREGTRRYDAAQIAESWTITEPGWNCPVHPSMPMSPFIL